MKPPLDRATQANQYRAHPCCVLPCRQWLLGIRPQILVCRISSVTACVCHCAGHTRRRCGAASLPSIDKAVGVGASFQSQDDLPILLQSANRYGQR
jgi:hypothetical protein